MTGKITLVSPPDVYVNRGYSIILVNTTAEEQEAISNWFSSNDLDAEVAIYFYNNEENLQWLVTAYNLATYRYINVDNTQDSSRVLTSYLLSLEKSFYTLSDNNSYEIFRLLNNSKLESVVDFLDKVIPVENVETPEL